MRNSRPVPARDTTGMDTTGMDTTGMDTSGTDTSGTDTIDEGRAVAVARLTDVFSEGRVSFELFTEVVDQLFAARDHAGLEAAMQVLPPPVRLTHARLRLTGPLVLRVADNRLELGSGWQLAADTTVATGFGAAHLDLTAASWDADRIDLRLETWGSIDVLVPEGVAVQLTGGSRPVQLQSVAPPIPGGPIVRISTDGPTGVIRVHQPGHRGGAQHVGWRRRGRNGRALAAASHTR